MRLPVETSSSWTHIVWASFTWASLEAWSQFEDLDEAPRGLLHELAAAVRGAIDNLLREARESQDRALFERPAAVARRDAWLTLGHRRLVEALNLVALKAGGGSKDHPVVREFLPGLLGGVEGAPYADRPRLLVEAAGRLEATAVEFADKADLVARLRAAAEGTQSASAASDSAWASWRGERSEEVVAKRRLRLEVERVHGRLRAEFPGQRAFVESFFPKSDTSAAASDEPSLPDAPAIDAPASPTPA